MFYPITVLHHELRRSPFPSLFRVGPLAVPMMQFVQAKGKSIIKRSRILLTDFMTPDQTSSDQALEFEDEPNYFSSCVKHTAE